MFCKIYFFLLLASTIVLSQTDQAEIQSIIVNAVRTNEIITIDGELSENIWQNEHSVSGFIQKDPFEGQPESQKTVIHFAYDDAALYIGARMYDSAPDSIIARLSRRDVYTNSDAIWFFIDPYFDRQTGFYFGVNAAGTQYDGVLFNDSWDDDSWDGVWEGKATIDDKGWSAEMKIPFSQLKFQSKDVMTWGVNVRRDITRNNERSYLVHVPKTESGFVSRFADLTGIANISPGGSIEILPYLTTKAEYLYRDVNDPFNNGSRYIPGLGADFKMGIGTNLTLNATINPDFGQVEIDPAVINLSDVESFFNEKRPFFIEGASVYNFGVGGSNNYWGFNWPGPEIFYSRRIGRVPQGSSPDADYVDYPTGTHILGAAKLTGKIGDGWNIGTIQALTSTEKASLSKDGSRTKIEVEPMAYYGIFRGKKEFNDGAQALGFISTITSRKFDNDRLRNEINSGAYVGGIDGWSFLDSSKEWVLTGWLGMSHVTGTPDRMIRLQRSAIHYFQRPDAKNLRVDSTAASLTGYAGRFYLNKQKGNVFFNSALGFVSPEFNSNDLGFMWRADAINFHVGSGYKWTELTEWTRHAEVGLAAYRNYDFDGNITWHGIFHFGYIRLLNYYSVNWNIAYNPPSISNRLTRGGPLTRIPPGYQVNFNIGTDFSKNAAGRVGVYTYQRPGYGYNRELYGALELKPADNITLTILPNIRKNNEFAQWVGAFTDPLATETYGKRYVFANLDQTTISAGIRLNWTLNPQLSLQLYMQPLISAGSYSNFKELKRGSSTDFLVYGEEGSTYDYETRVADPDGNGPAKPILIGNPDFNFKSLRGNAVLRWEYMPGSVLFLVWTQTRTDFEDVGDFNFNRSVERLIDTVPDNIFMIKFTYWFNI